MKLRFTEASCMLSASQPLHMCQRRFLLCWADALDTCPISTVLLVKHSAEGEQALLDLQLVATLGLTGVQPGDAGDVVFIRAVRDDPRHAGIGLQTEVGRITSSICAESYSILVWSVMPRSL